MKNINLNRYYLFNILKNGVYKHAYLAASDRKRIFEQSITSFSILRFAFSIVIKKSLPFISLSFGT